MSGLFSSLNQSVSALSAHSRAIETAGKNLANVSNTSYARQRVVYGDRGTVMTPQGAQSMGLEALSVEQIRDAVLDRQVVRESALTSYYETQQSAYRRAQAALGQNVSSAGSTTGTSSTNDTGIGAAIDGLFNAFQTFAANPTDTGVRQKLVQTATILTDRVRLADTRLAQVQSDLDAQVESDVTGANQLLETIADLNDQISRFEMERPGSAVDLRDQRQAALEKLSDKLPFTSTETTDGKVLISATTGSGSVDLVDDSGVTGTTTDSNGVIQTLTYDAATGTISGGATPTVLVLGSGSIKGSIDANTGAVQTLRDQLNQLTQQMVTSINAAYTSGYTATAGDPTGNFFDATAPVSAATFKLASAVTSTSVRASNAGGAGDNTIALNIVALATKKYTTPTDAIDGTFAGFYSGAVSGLGQAVSGATARVTEQVSIENLVRSQRDAVSGVSLDEELADLIKYQRAFQASSRVFQTIDNLLDLVVNQLSR